MLIDLISSPKAVAMTSQGNLSLEGHHNLINNLISTKGNGKLPLGHWREIIYLFIYFLSNAPPQAALFICVYVFVCFAGKENDTEKER